MPYIKQKDMPDFSMCSNSSCPLKETCYRQTAIPNPFRQAYGWFSPDTETGKCQYFLPIYED